MASNEKYSPDQPVVKGADVIYRPAGNAGEYAALATNPYKGCGHACAYCLAPYTLIQKADGTAVRLADVDIGDHLLGISQREEVRRAWNYTFCGSVVLNKIETIKPAFRIALDNGMSAVCSADHRWLTERGWKFTNQLTLNNQIRTFARLAKTATPTQLYQRGYLAGMIRGDGTLQRYDYSGRYQRSNRCAPQRTDVQHHFRLALKDPEGLDRTAAYLQSFGVETHRVDFAAAVGARAPMQAIRNHSTAAFEAITDLIEPIEMLEWQRGWLAGIFDAEGGTTSGCIRVYNTDADILELTERAMAAHGFRTVRDATASNGCTAVRIVGGQSELVRFFNLTAPAIGRKFSAVGSALRGSSRVVAVEPLNNQMKMLDITTSTENFIADGMISHNCYVPLATHQDRKTFDAGAVPRDGYVERLQRDVARYRTAGVCDGHPADQVFITFSSDPFHGGDLARTSIVLQILKDGGMSFCTLSKGGSRALPFLKAYRPERDAYAATLTTVDDDSEFYRKWERRAAPPSDRIAALREFYAAGIFTWVSIEPTLNAAESLRVIRETCDFVDLYKIGKANYVGNAIKIDWEDYTHRIALTCMELGKRHYIKHDLQKWLPPGYHNPLRVPQHNGTF